MDRLTGANFLNYLFHSVKILSGMDTLKNDVIAIFNEKVNSKSARNRQSSTFNPVPDKLMGVS